MNTDLRYGVFVLHRDSFDLRLTIGDIACFNRDKPNYAFKNGIELNVQAIDGHSLLSLKAKEAFSHFPWGIVLVTDFIWRCEDGTEIAGDKLQWHPSGDPAIRILYDLELVNDKGILTGSGLKGDLLLRSYVIDHVESVVLWDAIAGGREGYQKGK